MGWLGFIGTLISTIISTAISIGRENYTRQENYRYNEMSADNEDKRTRALYNDISSPVAQRGQIEQAGLSPSLFYSGGVAGTSGMTGANGGGGGNLSPTVYGVSASEMAQIENTNADTELKKAEAEKTKKEANVVEETAAAQITNLLADAGAKDAQTNYTRSQITYQNITNEIQNATKEAQIEEAISRAEYMQWLELKTFHEAESAATDADTKRKIQEQIIQESINRNANLVADTALKQSQKELNEQQKKNLVNDINVSWKQIDILIKNAETQARQADNAKVANQIRDKARLDAFKMWKNDWELMKKRYELDKTDLSYKYGEKTIKHLGSMNSFSTEKTSYNPIE